MRLGSHLAFEQLVLEEHSTPSYDSVFRVAPILDYKAFSQVQEGDLYGRHETTSRSVRLGGINSARLHQHLLINCAKALISQTQSAGNNQSAPRQKTDRLTERYKAELCTSTQPRIASSYVDKG